MQVEAAVFSFSRMGPSDGIHPLTEQLKHNAKEGGAPFPAVACNPGELFISHGAIRPYSPV